MKRLGGAILPCRPGGLNGSSERGTLAGGEADSWNAEDVGAKLTPERTLAAAAGDPDFGRCDAKCAEAVESVGQTEGDTLHGGPGQMGGGKVLHRDAVEDSAPSRKVRRAFAGKIWE